jgi:ABC-type glycerol-3-phosphate transport system permease component
MEENNPSGLPVTNVPPPDTIPEKPSPPQNSLLIKALCEEKEENYKKARDLYIELNRTDDAIRCSGKLNEVGLRKVNTANIYRLAGFAVLFILAFMWSLISLNKFQREVTALPVKWLNKGNAELTSYPSWFLYDKNAKEIRTKAVIDERMKLELEKTFPMRSDSTNFAEFRQAVEKLAFLSSDLKDRNYWLLLMVSGLAAVVGVFIREILDLIRHHCYEKDLDFRTWWPWYFLRPIVGFMFGIVVVLFSGTQLLFASGNDSSETYLIAIAILAGISVEDVMLKIRKVSMVLFANNNPEPVIVEPGQAGQAETGKEKPKVNVNQPEGQNGNMAEEDKSVG